MITTEFMLNDKQIKEYMMFIFFKYMIALSLLCVVFSVIYIFAINNKERDINEIILNWIVPLLFMILILVYVYHRTLSILRKDKNLSGKTFIQFSDEGIYLKSTTTEEQYDWTNITKIIQRKNIAVIIIKKMRKIGVPRELLTSEVRKEISVNSEIRI